MTLCTTNLVSTPSEFYLFMILAQSWFAFNLSIKIYENSNVTIKSFYLFYCYLIKFQPFGVSYFYLKSTALHVVINHPKSIMQFLQLVMVQKMEQIIGWLKTRGEYFGVQMGKIIKKMFVICIINIRYQLFWISFLFI